MSGDAISSKGVAMYLTKGSAEPYVTTPTAISKTAPAVVTAPIPTPPQLDLVPLDVDAGATTTVHVSATDFATLTAQGATPNVTFAGFVGDWAPMNGTKVATPGAAGSNLITVPVASAAFTPAEPDMGNATMTVEGKPLVLAIGQLVRVRESGFTSMDGQLFSISAIGSGTFTLLGSDNTDARGNLSTDARVDIWDSSDLVRLCLTAFTFNPETPGTTAVGTYCNPSATLPAVATSAGTATLTGWIDKNDPGYRELIKAAKDAVQRIFSIVLPQDQGEIVAPITFSSIAWDIPLDGGMGFTGTGALGSNPVHLFDEPTT